VFKALLAAGIASTPKWRDVTALSGRGSSDRSADAIPGPMSLMLLGLVQTLMAPVGVVQATAGLAPGQTDTRTSGDGATISGSLSKAEYDAVNQFSADGLTGKSEVHVQIAACPDANGHFTTKGSMRTSVASADGNFTSSSSIDVTLQGLVNDDAQLASSEHQTQSDTSYTVAHGGRVHVNISLTKSVVGDQVTAAAIKLNTFNWASDSEFANQQGEFTNVMDSLVSSAALDAAVKGWQSGRCVALDPTLAPDKRSGLKPGTAVIITAQPKSKIDGWPVGGTVKATISGDKTVAPADTKVPVVARFTYLAPDEKDKSGTVSLEARSRRGVAKADVSFDTNQGSYTAEGGLQDFHGTGTICDLAKPFTISGSGNTVTFTPRSATAGTTSYLGVMQGVRVYGHGTYTVRADQTGGTITAKEKGSVVTPLGVFSATGTEKYTLTPTSTC
jgi:hypothetical protein